MTLPLIGDKVLEFQEKIGKKYEKYYGAELFDHTYWFFDFGLRNLDNFRGFAGLYFLCPTDGPEILINDVVYAGESKDFGFEPIPEKVRLRFQADQNIRLFVCFEEEPYSEERRRTLLKEFLRKHPTHFMSGTHIS